MKEGVTDIIELLGFLKKQYLWRAKIPKKVISGLGFIADTSCYSKIYVIGMLVWPRWKKWIIKRKYGKHPAIYIDIWEPYEPRLLDLLPNTPWRESGWNKA